MRRNPAHFEVNMNRLGILPLLLLLQVLPAKENKCLYAEADLSILHSTRSKHLDSIGSNEIERRASYFYGPFDEITMRVTHFPKDDTTDYDWVGNTITSKSRSNPFINRSYLNPEWYPDSFFVYDSTGKILEHNIYRYGKDYRVNVGLIYGGYDSTVFSDSGMNAFKKDQVLFSTCLSTDSGCSCQQGLPEPRSKPIILSVVPLSTV